uniref:Nicotinamide-nucleotide adenylyltransferase n=1 Tax=Herpetomonas muscarum TaxID=5718 RepID=T1YTF9_HERMU|nr:nicotinamide-nucleotide adenylyltransferase [Herpetomonas muscarum]
MTREYRLRTRKLKRPSGRSGTQPVVVAVCGSFNPVHKTHLALYAAAKARLGEKNEAVEYEVLGGFLSPVSDAYGKPGLAPLATRLEILDLALADHPELDVDEWEGLQETYTRTAIVLGHLEDALNEWQKNLFPSEAVCSPETTRLPIRVVFACGADLFESFLRPGCWPIALLKKLLDRHLLVVVGRPGFGNDVEELAKRAMADGRTVLHEEKDGVVQELDLSRYKFQFTVFPKEDATSSTSIRALATQLSHATTPPQRQREARVQLEAMVPAVVADIVIKYYGSE